MSPRVSGIITLEIKNIYLHYFKSLQLVPTIIGMSLVHDRFSIIGFDFSMGGIKGGDEA